MSVVAAVWEPSTGSGIMASDSACTSEDGSVTYRVNDKLIKTGDVLVGLVGQDRPCTKIYRFCETTPSPPETALQLFYQLMGNELLSSDDDFECLLLDKDGIYLISGVDSFCKLDDHTYWAIGAGAPFALGTLWSDIDRVKRDDALVDRAVRSACEFNPFCKEPVWVIEL